MPETNYLINKNNNNLLTELINYESTLKQLYPKAEHDKKNQTDYKNFRITYGELEYDGCDTIVSYISKYNFDMFIDIGCGNGKLCFYMKKYPNIQRSIGIEIVKDRYLRALDLQEKLKNFSQSSNITFINDDFKKFDTTLLLNNIPFVWISNLCFEQETTNDIFNIIVNKFPIGTIIACSKIHKIVNPKIIFLDTIKAHMSWSKDSDVYIYKLV